MGIWANARSLDRMVRSRSTLQMAELFESHGAAMLETEVNKPGDSNVARVLKGSVRTYWDTSPPQRPTCIQGWSPACFTSKQKKKA